MESQNELPVFINVDQGAEYVEANKHNVIETMDTILLEDPTTEDLADNAVVLNHEPKVQLDESHSSQMESQDPENQEIKSENKSIYKPRIKCPECQRYTTDNEERMVRHIRKTHQGLNPFQCTMCEYSTYNKSVFEEHVRVHKGIKPFKCSHCPYRSASKKNKNKHELIHRKNNPLKCDQCSFIAHHYRSLLCHKQKHANGEVNQGTELQCDDCQTKFPSAITLNKHRSCTKKNVCDMCNMTFCTPYYLKKHMLSCHASDKKSFRCELCGWVGSGRMRVLLHLVHHPNQRVDESLYDVSVLRKYGIMS
ncbi:zinc finger protein 525 [Amyelois transitella]|uniref:zinc finger protein 525 n=1 Tax=Amyelois transitella TaxID=680683 RepID=UPI00067AF36E|nr:zinc finger protein 525 [Amyelois transitella]